MISASCIRQSPDLISLHGLLCFTTIEGLLPQGYALLGNVEEERVDLSDVQQCDSAGLALLVEWTRYTTKKGSKLLLCNCPEQVLEMIKIFGLDQVLTLS